ncbi:MAG: AAA family ATPase [Lachnospiraceae bacterium]
MRQFAFGTYEDFENLFKSIPVGCCTKFNMCEMPTCCDKRTAAMGFENIENTFTVYIEFGIKADGASESFNTFLLNGKATFETLTDLVAFCHSWQEMYLIEDNINDDIKDSAYEYPKHDVYNKEKLRQIEESEKQAKKVFPEDISKPLKERVFGQDECIDDLSILIVINKCSKKAKLLPVALLGPTATGKSETAKSLADVLSEVYDTKYGFIEIAGSEFIGEHTVHRFLGAPPGYAGYGKGTILDPVRKNPYHVIVINEIEKANEKLLVSLMEAIDTGYLGMSDNSKPIDLSKCILVFTSNLVIDMDEYNDASEFDKTEICRDAFTKHCGRPEISGKIGNFVVFNSLSDDAIERIIVKFVSEEMADFNLKLNHIDEKLMYEFKTHQTKYGARGIRVLVSKAIGKQLLRNRELDEADGKRVNLCGTVENISFEVEEG